MELKDQDILDIAHGVYVQYAGSKEFGYVNKARIEFARAIEKQVRDEAVSFQAQADAWRSLLQWTLNGESNVDCDARAMYAQDMLNGKAFEDWYDEVAGREPGHNAPPPAVLMVLRPYLLGKLKTPNA